MNIATLTLNPCLDVSYEFPTLIPDQKVHAKHTRFDPGGNGINVGRALKRLGIRASNFALIGGEIGLLVRRLVKDQLDDFEAVEIPGETRINCTILEENPRTQYEIDGMGPEVPPEALKEIEGRFVSSASGGFGVLTGSLPAGVPTGVYGELVRMLLAESARPVVDTKGEMLEIALEQHPFLIKPNRYELEQLCGRRLTSLDEVLGEALALRTKSTYVCVSLGEDGALLVGPEGAFHATAPRVRVRSTVGAGDSLVGGLVAGFVRGLPPKEALRLAVSCGSGTASKPGTELFDPGEIVSLKETVEVKRIL